jgi:hypothetical protein
MRIKCSVLKCTMTNLWHMQQHTTRANIYIKCVFPGLSHFLFYMLFWRNFKVLLCAGIAQSHAMSISWGIHTFPRSNNLNNSLISLPHNFLILSLKENVCYWIQYRHSLRKISGLPENQNVILFYLKHSLYSNTCHFLVQNYT